jgi:hypothetical protein
MGKILYRVTVSCAVPTGSREVTVVLTPSVDALCNSRGTFYLLVHPDFKIFGSCVIYSVSSHGRLFAASERDS